MYNQELYYSTFSPVTATLQSPLLPVKFVTTDACALFCTPLVIHFCGKVSEISPLTPRTLRCTKSNQHPSKFHLLVPHFPKSSKFNDDLPLTMPLLLHFSSMIPLVAFVKKYHFYLQVSYLSSSGPLQQPPI